MYNGQENGYRNPIITDCLTAPHNSEHSFSYPWMGRTNGYSAMNGNGVNGHVNGHINGHINNVGRQGKSHETMGHCYLKYWRRRRKYQDSR